jgi:hypothetical protein
MLPIYSLRISCGLILADAIFNALVDMCSTKSAYIKHTSRCKDAQIKSFFSKKQNEVFVFLFKTSAMALVAFHTMSEIKGRWPNCHLYHSGKAFLKIHMKVK